MASLNVDLDYFEHPKTVRLIGLLGRGADVLPIRLWAYCGKYHAEDGKLAGYSPQEIEAQVKWWGKAGECVEALVKVRFLVHDGTDYVVHDWLEHAGHIHAFKVRARASAKKRWGSVPDAKGNATSIPSSIAPSNAPSNALAGQGKARQGKAVGARDDADRLMVALGSSLGRYIEEAAPSSGPAQKQAARARAIELVAEFGSVEAVAKALRPHTAPATGYLSVLFMRLDKAREAATKGAEPTQTPRRVLTGRESMEDIIG